MAGNKSLRIAEKAKVDEFYTQLSDIEKEMRYYRKHFKDKVVFCNCDDPFESNFFKYFVLNFNRLGLKKLIATCYASSPIANTRLSLFDITGTEEDKQNKAYKAVITKVYDKSGDGGIDMFDVAELFKSGENELTELTGDGDFRSAECLALLDESDIVVTNPPFSLFREYISILLERHKYFIIIGSQNAITYQEIFPLLMDNKIWLGYGNGDMSFRVPDYFEPRETRFWIDENGQKYFITHNVGVQISHCICTKIQKVSNLWSNKSRCGKYIKHTVQEKRRRNNRSRMLPRPYTHVSKNTTKYKCFRIYGILKGKKLVNDIW